MVELCSFTGPDLVGLHGLGLFRIKPPVCSIQLTSVKRDWLSTFRNKQALLIFLPKWTLNKKAARPRLKAGALPWETVTEENTDSSASTNKFPWCSTQPRELVCCLDLHKQAHRTEKLYYLSIWHCYSCYCIYFNTHYLRTKSINWQRI